MLEKLGSVALTIGIVILVGKLLTNVTKRLLNASYEKLQPDEATKAKFSTIERALRSVIKGIVTFIIIVVILDMLGIDTKSIIATAGIGGIAIAFGAQSLVKDFITGVFLISDDQLRVGELVTLAGVTGTVESVGLRNTRILDADGAINFIPNSQITNVTNLSRGKADLFLSFDLANKVDLNTAKDIVEKVSEELSREYTDREIISPLTYLGIDENAVFSYKVMTSISVIPAKKFEIKRRVMELIKMEIDEREIYREKEEKLV